MVMYWLYWYTSNFLIFCLSLIPQRPGVIFALPIAILLPSPLVLPSSILLLVPRSFLQDTSSTQNQTIIIVQFLPTTSLRCVVLRRSLPGNH